MDALSFASSADPVKDFLVLGIFLIGALFVLAVTCALIGGRREK